MIILGYIIVGILMILMGQAVKHLNLKMPPVVSEEITYKEFFKSLKSDFKIDIKYSLILIILSFLVLYLNGFCLTSYIYILMLPALMIIFSIDYRFQLIPDEAHVYLGILGLINLIANLSNWTSYVLGLITGGGIFLMISLLAMLILKKEGMGFGDVKLMATLGFVFGFKNILVITLVSFFIGAIIGGILLIVKRKDKESYIPFGPFIVIGSIIIMYVSPDVIIGLYMSLCLGLSNVVTDVIYKVMN